MDDMYRKSAGRRFVAGLLAALLLLGLWGCNQQPEQTDQTEDPTQDKPALPDHEGPLTKEEYEAVCQQYYDELMLASNVASV